MKKNLKVITTVNPFGDVEYQKKCFESWKRAGYSILSFNAETEAVKLYEFGFEQTDVRVIPDNETTFNENGKYLPKVAPIIARVAKDNQDVIITNADIFALHSVNLQRVFASLANAIAFTRREVISLDCTDIRDNEFYRGGLDLFYLSSSSLSKFSKELLSFPSANSMAFGVPGWDYLLGAYILRKLNGKICDGPIVAHTFHKNTYSALEDFSIYAVDIAKMLHWGSSDPYEVANQFAREIEQNCLKNITERTKLQIFYNSNGSKVQFLQEDITNIHLKDVDGLLELADVNKFKTVLQKTFATKDWALANQFAASCFVRTSAFTAKIFCLWNYLNSYISEYSDWKTDYPKGNLHGKAIENTSYLKDDDKKNAIFDLFSTELVNFGIFNKRLFDYLIWSCETETQLKILDNIKAIVRAK